MCRKASIPAWRSCTAIPPLRSRTPTRCSKPAELPGTLPAQAYQLSVTLRDFLVTNKLARGVYLYYPRTGLVVGNMGCFEALPLRPAGVPQREGYDAWLAELTKSHDTRFMLLQMPRTNACAMCARCA